MATLDIADSRTEAGTEAPRWVWSRELFELLDAEMRVSGASLAELARRASDRFDLDAESVERRLRAARRADTVTDVHTADRLLVLVGRHLLDLPCYRDALAGRTDRAAWPRRGAHPQSKGS